MGTRSLNVPRSARAIRCTGSECACVEVAVPSSRALLGTGEKGPRGFPGFRESRTRSSAASAGPKGPRVFVPVTVRPRFRALRRPSERLRRRRGRAAYSRGCASAGRNPEAGQRSGTSWVRRTVPISWRPRGGSKSMASRSGRSMAWQINRKVAAARGLCDSKTLSWDEVDAG